MSTPLADCAALAPLLSAFARGTKRSRLRQLVVVCPSGHTLVEVFPTPDGPHAIWQSPSRPSLDGIFAESVRLHWMAAPLVQLVDEHRGVAEAVYLDEIAACRCTKSAPVDGHQLTKWLETGARRAVVET